MIKNVSVKLFSFFNGGSIGDCLSNSSVSSVEVLLVIKNVSVKFYSFNGGSIGDEERVCQTLQFLQWRQYW